MDKDNKFTNHQEAREFLKQRFGRSPTDAEVSKFNEIKLEKLDKNPNAEVLPDDTASASVINSLLKVNNAQLVVQSHVNGSRARKDKQGAREQALKLVRIHYHDDNRSNWAPCVVVRTWIWQRLRVINDKWDIKLSTVNRWFSENDFSFIPSECKRHAKETDWQQCIFQPVDLFSIEGITNNEIFMLSALGIQTVQELADLSVHELKDLYNGSVNLVDAIGLHSPDDVFGVLIMKARETWE